MGVSNTALNVLVLKNNMLDGEIPTSFLYLSSLQTLDLSNNRLQGELPSGSANAAFPLLRILNIANNTLSGALPSWLWSLPEVQIIDLSRNHFIGDISRNLSLLRAYCTDQTFTNKSSFVTYDGFELIIKNGTYSSSYISKWQTSLDLSYNNLGGSLPADLESLIGLYSLNLAHNNFTGNIPKTVAQMKSLEVIDLSHNTLNGSIPQDLGNLNFLDYLDFSYNNLSGPIPTSGNFNTRYPAADFQGNPLLCGYPLTACTQGNGDSGPTSQDNGSGWFSNNVSAPGFALGTVIGFVSMMVALTLWKPTRQLMIPLKMRQYL